MIEIKHRFNGRVLHTVDADTLEGADLRGADLRGADLLCANLRRADLEDANLYCADLRSANLFGANLYGADLEGADLYGADLEGANLRHTIGNSGDIMGNNKEIISMSLKYDVTICKSTHTLAVGCQQHKIGEFMGFSDRRILEMDGKGGLVWWKANKDMILKQYQEM